MIDRDDTDRRDIAHRLAAAGIGAEPIRTDRLQFGRLAVRLGDGAGFVKLAQGSFAVAQARREAVAYAAPPPRPPFIRPALLGFHDGGDWAALWLSHADGAPQSPWRSLLVRAGPFEGEAGADGKSVVRPLSAVLAGMVPEGDVPSGFIAYCRALLDRDGDCPVACRRAHGDFIYWNVLRRRAAPPVLIDFEYCVTDAPLGHDRLYWTAVPLLRRAAAIGGDGVVARIAQWFVRFTGERHRAALFLLHLGRRLELEQAAAATLGDLASPEFLRRVRLLALLDRLMRDINP
ncbi:hypothetical protein [Azospirillum sp. TSH100]|uniref:hypothetical protein n=1 Tax=Azospirillum sp. TSH100 TaxID=652764 RepID=UPI00145C12AE|nr:hypothetical protein [Azospirillum sp. TSH100]